jgi:hypothetical protein
MKPANGSALVTSAPRSNLGEISIVIKRSIGAIARPTGDVAGHGFLLGLFELL